MTSLPVFNKKKLLFFNFLKFVLWKGRLGTRLDLYNNIICVLPIGEQLAGGVFRAETQNGDYHKEYENC